MKIIEVQENVACFIVVYFAAVWIAEASEAQRAKIIGIETSSPNTFPLMFVQAGADIAVAFPTSAVYLLWSVSSHARCKYILFSKSSKCVWPRTSHGVCLDFAGPYVVLL